MKKLTKILIALGVLVIVGFLYSIYNPSSRINCQHDEIDILTGRYRYQRYILFMKVYERIEETDISRRWKKHFREYPSPNWKMVNTFSGFGGGHSPHHVFHGALHAARNLEMAFGIASFSGEAEKRVIQKFLNLLQTENNYYLAEQYSLFVGEIAISKEGKIVEVDDISSFDEWVKKLEK